MNNLIRKFYVLGLILSVVVATGLFFQYNYFYEILMDERTVLTMQSRDIVGSEIKSKVRQKAQIISNTTELIALGICTDEELLEYFKALMKQDPAFNSIYFGSVDNEMINGSGWVKPETFDLRTRPWYVKAVNEGKLVLTEAFVNASKDRLIITIAKPVYNAENKLLGVVSGDVDVRDIVSIIHNEKISEKGYSFLIDGKGQILAHPGYEYNFSSGLKSVKDISADIQENILKNISGIAKIKLEGEEGFLAYQPIENTDWTIASFIPLDDYAKNLIQYFRIFIITLVSSLMVFLMLQWQQKKDILEPILDLDKDVNQISLEDNISYRMPINEKDPFEIIRKSINKILDKSNNYLYQLEEANLVKDRFLANMGHEIKTPMNAIIALSHLALEEGQSQKTKYYLDKIQASGRILLKIFSDIIDYYQFNLGKYQKNNQVFFIEREIKLVLDMFEHEINKNNIRSIYRVDENVPETLLGDTIRIRQILINLIGNAVKFTEKGQIEVFASATNITADQIKVLFTVKDTGVGIPEIKKTTVFELFTQGDESTTRKYDGTGLGLAICKQLADMMGGEIYFESQEGQGSTFYFKVTLHKNIDDNPADSLDKIEHSAGKLSANREEKKEENHVSAEEMKQKLNIILDKISMLLESDCFIGNDLIEEIENNMPDEIILRGKILELKNSLEYFDYDKSRAILEKINDIKNG
ncbi:sensor histidine kinase [Heliophilum fasciatum]|uniref:Circadian input-output histidine kinase CikA n=1 Tax=Heliophilum fasciatum TaxID=35700 RepID=A0A4V2SX03_9FIRM|nr:cache domain-containing protein [Heliophilum fasciatum]MCW2277994.1 signal transduction histidine kinase [Heliophilum fasciatum]TCP64386.1 signal transduction histidine kinase [Heliophilum fasciatum]